MILLFALMFTISALGVQTPLEMAIGEFQTCVYNLNRDTQFCETEFLRPFVNQHKELKKKLWIKESLNEVLNWSKKPRPFLIAQNNHQFLYGNATYVCQSVTKEVRSIIQVCKQGFVLIAILFFLAIGFTFLTVKKKQGVKLLILFLMLVPGFLCGAELNVYTYDGITQKEGIGDTLKQEFKKTTGQTLNLISFGSAGEALNQIIIEQKNTKADVLLGIDSSFSNRAKETGLFEPVNEKFFKNIKKELRTEKDKTFLPFDYGYLAFIYNKRILKEVPSLKDNTTFIEFIKRKDLNKKVVVADPRTSSVGSSFLFWTLNLVPSVVELKEIWKGLFPKIITFSPGWSGAYAMFVRGDVDFVVSYTTSLAYDLEKKNKTEFQILFFEDGHALQVEGAGQLKSSKKQPLIEAFFNVLRSDAIQSKIPLTQWMYPVLEDVKLPQSFERIRIPKKKTMEKVLSENERKDLLRQWATWGADFK